MDANRGPPASLSTHLFASKMSTGDSEDSCLTGVAGKSEMVHIELSSAPGTSQGERLLAVKTRTAASPARW